jgi:hypothetical protein
LTYSILALMVSATRAEPIRILGVVPGSENHPAPVELELIDLATQREVRSPTVSGLGLEIAAPGPGFWRIVARASGAAPAALDLLPLLEPAVLPALEPAPARRVRVRVNDPSGKPIASAAVRVEAATGAGTWGPLPAVAATAQDGSVVVEVPPFAALRLTVTAPGFLLERAEGKSGDILVTLQPGVGCSVQTAPGVRVTTADGLNLGTTDTNGHLDVTVPRGGATGLGLLAPDCRWARGELREGLEGVFPLRPPRIVRGRVTDRRTRQPIAGAWVWVDGALSCSAKTDESGEYSLAAPGFEEIHLQGAAAGHLPGGLALGPSGATPDLALAAVPGRPAAGLVVDLQGKAVSAAEVVLRGAAGGDALKASTDAQGRFHLELTGAGPFDLQVRARGFSPTRVRGVVVPLAAGPADLGIVVLGFGAALMGQVADPSASPIEGATVEALPAEGLKPGDPVKDRQTVTDKAGRFSLKGFQEGEALILRVARKGYATRTVKGISPGPESLAVVLTPAARISGTVVDESGNPVEGAKLLLSEDREEKAGSVGGLPARLVAAAETSSSGRFELTDLAPGRFRLTALIAGFLPEARSGLLLKEGEAMDSVDLVLGRGAILEGQISTPDGAPAAGAKVIVLQDGVAGLAGRPEARADADGRYEIGGLAEGEREVLAELDGFQPARGPVRIQEGTNRLDLRLAEGFEVSGRVAGSEGPIVGASVRLLPQRDGAAAPLPGSTGPDGAFRFPSVGEGSYQIEVEKPGYTLASAAPEVQIASAPVTGLEVKLERGGAVAGRVLGLGFQELAQVRIVATAPDRTGQMGTVDYQGRYRVEGLPPGEWKVVASLPQGRQAGGLVSLGGGQGEAQLDIEFAAGFTLAGRILRGGVPVGGAVVLVEGADGSGGDTVTGADGSFRVVGLRPGPCSLTALDPRSGARLDQRLDLQGDREVVLPLPDIPSPGVNRR